MLLRNWFGRDGGAQPVFQMINYDRNSASAVKLTHSSRSEYSVLRSSSRCLETRSSEYVKSRRTNLCEIESGRAWG